MATSAAFVGVDTSRQGSWIGAYGAEGHAIVADATSLPAYATVAPVSQSDYVWNASTADVRALQRAAGGGRLAATWYSPTSFDINVNLTDAAVHQVALYMIDWDAAGRQQRVDVVDAVTGGILDTRTVSGFQSGQYLIWSLRGHVRFRLTRLAGRERRGQCCLRRCSRKCSSDRDLDEPGEWHGVHGPCHDRLRSHGCRCRRYGDARGVLCQQQPGRNRHDRPVLYLQLGERASRNVFADGGGVRRRPGLDDVVGTGGRDRERAGRRRRHRPRSSAWIRRGKGTGSARTGLKATPSSEIRPACQPMRPWLPLARPATRGRRPPQIPGGCSELAAAVDWPRRGIHRRHSTSM